jgi:hypothetical protein
MPEWMATRIVALLLGLYGIDRTVNFRRAATCVDRILKGEKPAELPVQAPIKFELVNVVPESREGSTGSRQGQRSRTLTHGGGKPIGFKTGLFDIAIKEEFMRMRLFVAAAGFAALSTPSLAAEFYIVQDSPTKRCTIVEHRPTSQTTVVVEGGRTFTTRQEAEGAMKTVKVCESGGTVGGPVPPPPPR